jgi:FAD/FMN-containing dehydrogenase
MAQIVRPGRGGARVTATAYGDGLAGHAARVARLRAQLDTLPHDAPVRLGKRTSNLFRTRVYDSSPRLDVSGFDTVLAVDPEARTADVGGMTTYESLVDATLPHGLMPLVVPQLKSITLGGAVTGLGIESSSFRDGLPHESVTEMEVLTGDARVLLARPDNEHRDLLFGFPNSYGTLGYALRLTIELAPVRPYVRLRHVRHDDRDAFFAELARVCADRAYAGEPVDFVDGTVFGPEEMYLSLGTFVDAAPYTSDYTRTHIYYKSIQQRSVDFLTVRDYLWRWDTDWFWCSRAFGVQRPTVRRVLGRRFLRSDVYWKVVNLERRYGVKRRLDSARGKPELENVVQDVDIPVGRAAEFLDFFQRDIRMSPVWVCPFRQRDGASTWPLYVLDPEALYVNFGFWGTVPLQEGEQQGTHNRLIEEAVERLGGRKSLYSDAYYSEDEFWRLYNGPAYNLLKKTYDPDGRLLDLYAKCVQRR